MLWPKASPLDLDFGLCAWAKLFNMLDTGIKGDKKRNNKTRQNKIFESHL